MSYRGKVLKGRISKGGILNRLLRFRYYKGHSIHSPFMYIVVRYILTNRELFNPSSTIYSAIIDLEISKRTAIEISNLAHHIGCQSLAIDGNITSSDLTVLTTLYSDSDVRREVDRAKESGTAVVILSPYSRKELCNEILKSHTCTSIDRYNYILLLNNHLPKQHFRV